MVKKVMRLAYIVGNEKARNGESRDSVFTVGVNEKRMKTKLNADDESKRELKTPTLYRATMVQ